MKPNATDQKIINYLARFTTEYDDFGCMSFADIARATKLDRAVVRRSCRKLARNGLAEFHKGLWSEDGEPRGAGYCVSKAGAQLAEVAQ